MYVPTLPHPLCPRGHTYSWPLTKNEVGTSQLLGFTHQPTSHSTHLPLTQEEEDPVGSSALGIPHSLSGSVSAAVEGGHDSSHQGQLLSLTL